MKFIYLMLSHHPLAAMILVCSAVLVSPVCASDETVLDSLGSGRNTWLSEVEFKCTYTYTECVAPSEEAAEQQDDRCAVTLKAHGEMIKRNQNTLYSCFVDRDEYTPNQVDDFIAVISDQLRCRYVPSNKSNGELTQAFVTPRQPDKAHLPYPYLAAPPHLDPLTYGGGMDTPNFITSCQRWREERPDSFSWSIESSTETTVIVEAVVKYESETTHFVVHYDMTHSYPLITELVQRTDFHHDDIDLPTITSHTWAEDFVVLSNGLSMPSRIRRVHGPMRGYMDELMDGLEGQWRGMEWVSTDLGLEAPTEEDFAIQFKEGSSIGGLKPSVRKSLVASGKPFEINEYSLSDLDVGLQPLPERNPTSGTGFTLRLFFAFASVAIVIVAGFYWRYRRAK
jgi:hypothetical protein